MEEEQGGGTEGRERGRERGRRRGRDRGRETGKEGEREGGGERGRQGVSEREMKREGSHIQSLVCLIVKTKIESLCAPNEILGPVS